MIEFAAADATKVPVTSGSVSVLFVFEFGDVTSNTPVPLALPVTFI
jgi:hypothetical protein